MEAFFDVAKLGQIMGKLLADCGQIMGKLLAMYWQCLGKSWAISLAAKGHDLSDCMLYRQTYLRTS